VTSPYGSGSFLNVLREAFPATKGGVGKEQKVVTTRVNDRDDIYESLRTFFKAGK
jgi:uncharacterized protein